MPLRVVFMGTPEFAVPALQAILKAGHDVVAVYTRAPQPKGRGQHIQKSPIHELADARGIPVYTPASFKKSPEACAEFSVHQADVAVVAAYGLILPLSVLKAPRFGCLNIHASLLPRWRGASPIQQAVWARDPKSGVTIMKMDEGLDTGPMIVCEECLSVISTPQLHDALSQIGGKLIVDVLATLDHDGKVVVTPQPTAGVTHAPMLKKEDGRIVWENSCADIDAQIRALNPWPGTFTHLPDGSILKVLEAERVDAVMGGVPGTLLSNDGLVACGDAESLLLRLVQAPSGKKMDIPSLINGGYIKVGQAFLP
jgi:methionyl-tRNA formyltransferase